MRPVRNYTVHISLEQILDTVGSDPWFPSAPTVQGWIQSVFSAGNMNAWVNVDEDTDTDWEPEDSDYEY